MNKELGLRIITGLIGAALIVTSLVYSYFGMWVLCVIISMFGLWEILGIMEITKRRYRWTSMIFGAAIWIAYLYKLFIFHTEGEILTSSYDFSLSILIFPTLALIALFHEKEANPFQTLSNIMMSFIYCYLPLILLYHITVPELSSEYHYALPLGILFLTWFLDSFAYFGGRLFGKHPLFPRISPKKTWEGALTGVVFCMGLGIALSLYTEPRSYNWLIIAGIISVISQLGDLVESMFKRSRQIKDSGKLLPGHGGMLDRFDGVYLSVPFIYLYFSFL